MKITELTSLGQLKPGDLVLLRAHSEIIFPATVKEVKKPNRPDEEILLNADRDLYFITKDFLVGKSWVKECRKVVNGKMYSNK